MRDSEIQREASDASCNDATPSSSLGRTVGTSMRTGDDDGRASYSCSGVFRQSTTMSRVLAAAWNTLGLACVLGPLAYRALVQRTDPRAGWIRATAVGPER
jgi:hypothetical protein